MRVKGLSCSRGERRLFEGLEFSVAGGECLVVSGPNGVGKTTLLRAIAGLLRADAGSISLDVAGDEGPPALAAHFLGHRDGLRAALSVRENLTLAPAVLGQSGLAPEEAAQRLNLMRLLDLPVGVLSAGQRRRTALARLLVCARPVWLLDEPTSALDAPSQDMAAGLMGAHAAAGGMVIAATHLDLGIAAKQLVFDASGGHRLLEARA